MPLFKCKSCRSEFRRESEGNCPECRCSDISRACRDCEILEAAVRLAISYIERRVEGTGGFGETKVLPSLMEALR